MKKIQRKRVLWHIVFWILVLPALPFMLYYNVLSSVSEKLDNLKAEVAREKKKLS